MNPEARARELFARTFDAAPLAVASAPGRVNLIGDHVDYHGGHVLPVATTMRTAVAVGPWRPGFRAVSEHGGEIRREWPAAPTNAWSDYVTGVATLFDPGTSAWAKGFAVAVASDLSVGAGLSSSAALEVASVLALGRWAGRTLSPGDAANLAWRAETEVVGVPCGRMDQIASVMAEPGSALLLNCRTLETRTVPVAVDLVVVDSGETHQLRSSAYAERRREGARALELLQASVPAIALLVDIPPARVAALARGLPEPLGRRVRHVVGENQRVILAARALEGGDGPSFGALVNASHDSLRDLYDCSTPGLDAIVTAARGTRGVLGARLVGAGWGGAVLVVAQSGTGESVAERLKGIVVVPGAGAMNG